jgi:hypothetical protein
VARMPENGVLAVAPIDLVRTRVCVNDDAATMSTIRPRQDRVTDYRSAWVAPDNHDRRPVRCLISATKLRPRLSTTSQENGPRNCVTPNLWTARRASASEQMPATRRPSPVTTIHIGAPRSGSSGQLRRWTGIKLYRAGCKRISPPATVREAGPRATDPQRGAYPDIRRDGGG